MGTRRAYHYANHCDMDKGDTVFEHSFVVFDQAAIETDPCDKLYDGLEVRIPSASSDAGQAGDESESAAQLTLVKGCGRCRQPRCDAASGRTRSLV